MEWVIESYDRRTDRDGENRFTTESASSARLRTYSATLGRGSYLQNPSRWHPKTPVQGHP
jgi:hypothetical protein